MKKSAMAGLAVLALAGLVTAGCRPTKKTSAVRPASSTSVPATTSTSEAAPAPASSTAPRATATPPATSTATAGCRSGDPLANVYHPDRLSVLQPCMTVSGTVSEVRAEDDGDSHVYLALDPLYAASLKLTSLLLEIVPADKPGCTPDQPPRPASGSYDYGHCTGANESDPPVGSHVTVTGPYVYDEDHHWNEIHPVWAISTSPGVATAPAPTPTPVTPAPTTTPAATPPPAASTGVTIVSVSSPVDAGAYASLVARTSPGAACNLSVILPSGRQSQSSGLGGATADGSGQVTWNWRTGTTTRGGTATATVTCGSASATGTFQISG